MSRLNFLILLIFAAMGVIGCGATVKTVSSFTESCDSFSALNQESGNPVADKTGSLWRVRGKSPGQECSPASDSSIPRY